jgi:GlpG protein
MRHIGHLPDETQARVFGDFLVACGVPNHVERDDDGSWSLWITNEDHVPTAQSWLARFRADPASDEFRKATAEAAKVRKAEAEALAAYRKRIHTRRSLFPKFGGYGMGIVTFLLIALCAIVALYTQLGESPAKTLFFIDDPDSGVFLGRVRAGEFWRLLTPIFLHLSVTHIVFNMLALYQLGCMIEARRGSWHLVALVVVLGLGSNLAQYVAAGPGFGGMSGVVFGLIGYVWMRGKYDRASGLVLDRTYLTISLVWLVACYTGWLGPVANTAHVAGLALGALWGRLAASRAMRKPE